MAIILFLVLAGTVVSLFQGDHQEKTPIQDDGVRRLVDHAPISPTVLTGIGQVNDGVIYPLYNLDVRFSIPGGYVVGTTSLNSADRVGYFILATDEHLEERSSLHGKNLFAIADGEQHLPRAKDWEQPLKVLVMLNAEGNQLVVSRIKSEKFAPIQLDGVPEISVVTP